MIIVVNIGKTLVNSSHLEATKRAWSLKLNKCKEHEYVIGVAKGKIECYFQLIDVKVDKILANRVEFELKTCTPKQITFIDEYIREKDSNLFSIQRGKYI